MRPTGDMTRQRPYLAPGQHADLQIHIDCALYFYFITIRLIHGGRPDNISPEGIHLTRPIIAWYLATGRSIPDVSFWFDDLAPHTLPVSPSFAISSDVTPNRALRMADDHCHNLQQIPHSTERDLSFHHADEYRAHTDMISEAHDQPSHSGVLLRSRPMLPRRVKPSWTPETDTVVPLPSGRLVIKQYTQT